MEQLQTSGTFFPPNEKITIHEPAVTIMHTNGTNKEPAVTIVHTNGGDKNDEIVSEDELHVVTENSRGLVLRHNITTPDNSNTISYVNDDEIILSKKRKFTASPGNGPHQCLFCGARFTSAANMNRHRKRHFNIKAFKCCICQKDFGRRDHLTQHLEIHIKNRPFICPICNEFFDARDILKDHLITKHIDNNPEEKICKLCGHESQTSRGAKLHYTSRHFNNRLMIGQLPHGYEPPSEMSVILTVPENNASKTENNNTVQETEKFTTRRNPRKDKNPTKIVASPIEVEDYEEEEDEDEEEDIYSQHRTFVQQVSPDVVLMQSDEEYTNRFKCEVCGIIYPDRTLYFLHKGFHTELDPWKCNICGVKCQDKYDFHVHLLNKAHS